MTLMSVPRSSAGGGITQRNPSGWGLAGRGSVSNLGQMGYPGPFHILFSFFPFFFCSPISFITFAFWLQFDSNQNLKFSNIKTTL
jgi:hypothetical protein